MFWYNLACVALICTHKWLVPYQFTFQHIDPILAKFVHDLEIKFFFYQKLGSRRNNSISCLKKSNSCFENQSWTLWLKWEISCKRIFYHRPWGKRNILLPLIVSEILLATNIFCPQKVMIQYFLWKKNFKIFFLKLISTWNKISLY